MTPEELAEELSSGVLRPAYLVAGPEALLREEATAAIRAAVVDPASADFNHDRLDGDATTGGRLLDALRTLPVMAERRLVELREPEARRGGGLADALAEGVSGLADGPVVLLVTAAKIDKRSRWVKAFGKPAVLVACDPPKNAKAAVAFVSRLAERSGVPLARGAAELLVESSVPSSSSCAANSRRPRSWPGPAPRWSASTSRSRCAPSPSSRSGT